MAQNDKRPFGARDLKIFVRTASTPTYGTGVDIGCFTKLQFDPKTTEEILKGDDVVCSAHSQLENIEISVSHGGYALPVYAAMFGHTLTDSGTTPNEATFLNMKISDKRPFFGFIALAYGAEGGTVLIIGYKTKLFDGGGATLENGKFTTPDFKWTGIPSDYDSDTILRCGNFESSTITISTTWLSNNVHI